MRIHEAKKPRQNLDHNMPQDGGKGNGFFDRAIGQSIYNSLTCVEQQPELVVRLAKS
jgi:hypothetical protein